MKLTITITEGPDDDVSETFDVQRAHLTGARTLSIVSGLLSSHLSAFPIQREAAEAIESIELPASAGEGVPVAHPANEQSATAALSSVVEHLTAEVDRVEQQQHDLANSIGEKLGHYVVEQHQLADRLHALEVAREVEASKASAEAADGADVVEQETLSGD